MHRVQLERAPELLFGGGQIVSGEEGLGEHEACLGVVGGFDDRAFEGLERHV